MIMMTTCHFYARNESYVNTEKVDIIFGVFAALGFLVYFAMAAIAIFRQWTKHSIFTKSILTVTYYSPNPSVRDRVSGHLVLRSLPSDLSN